MHLPRSTTYIKTPAEGFIFGIAEAKEHLRVDDTEMGVSASVTSGTSNSQIVLSSRLTTTQANSWTLEIIENGNDTALSVTRNGAAFIVNLATDSMGVGTSTVNDVIAAIVESDDLSTRITASAGTGNGTGLLLPHSSVSFSGGAEGTSDHDSWIAAAMYAIQPQIETILRGQLLPQTVVRLQDWFGGCQRIVLDGGPVQSVSSVKYRDIDGVLQTLDSSIYTVHNKGTPSFIELHPGQFWPCTWLNRSNTVEIEYITGYADAESIPGGIKMAAKLILGHLFTNRESVQIIAGVSNPIIIPQSMEWLLWPFRDLRF